MLAARQCLNSWRRLLNNDVENDHALPVEKALAVLQEFRRIHRIDYFEPSSDQRGFYRCGCKKMVREFKDPDRNFCSAVLLGL